MMWARELLAPVSTMPFKRLRPVRLKIFRSLCHRRALLGVLVLAVAVYGVSSTLVSLLGPNHVHRSAANADPFSGWQDIRRVSGVRMVPLHDHSHDDLARHHHALNDASVAALDAGAGSDGAGGDDARRVAGAAVLVLALAKVAALPALTSTQERWSSLTEPRRAGRTVAPLERPPRV